MQKQKTHTETLTRRERAVLVVVTMGMGLAALDIDIPSAALPQIASQLHGIALLSEVFTIYLVSSVVGMLLFGRLSDHYGRKPIFLLGIGIFMVGCLLAANAPTMGFFLGCRAIQGFGAGALPPLAMVIAADLIADEGRLGRAQSIMNIVWGISATLGPAIGGTIADSFSWRGIFLVMLIVAAITLGLVAVIFQEKRPGLPVATIAATTQMFEKASKKERWRVWLSPPVLAGYLACLLFGATILPLFAYLPLFVQGVLGQGARDAGIVLAPLAISWTISQILGGMLMNRFDTAPAWGWIMVAGCMTMVAAWMGLFLLLHVQVLLVMLVPAVLLLGCGGGLFNTPSIVIVPRFVDESFWGLANGLVEASYSIGGALGIFVAGIVFGSSMGTSLDAVGTALLDKHARSLLSPQQSQQLIALLASGLHSVYLFACLAAWVLLGAAIFLALAYTRKKKAEARQAQQDSALSSGSLTPSAL